MLLQDANDFVLPKEIVKLQIKFKDPSKKMLTKISNIWVFLKIKPITQVKT
jgi:hypothetical protein